MKRKLILGSILLAIVIPNTPFIGTEILKKIDGDYFRYANADASFTSTEHIDIYDPWISTSTAYFFVEETRPKAQNMEIFRLYQINPFCFWRWRYYLNVSKNFSYKGWDTIEKDRAPFVKNNKWQHF